MSAITEDKIILLGPRNVMALSTGSGALQWNTTCPEPAGHGLIAGGAYLLPLVDGRCLNLSIVDGAISGSRFGKLLHQLSEPPSERPTSESPEIQLVSYDGRISSSPTSPGRTGGNLLASGDDIVVTTPTSVIVYPQARPLLQSLTAMARTGRSDQRQSLEAAMLHLLLGDQSAAQLRLRELLKASGSGPVQQTATRLLREILFQELAVAADPRPILDQLAAMPANDPDRLRLLVGRIDAELKLGSPVRLTEALDAFRRADRTTYVSPDSESDYFVQASAYVADQIALARSETGGNVRAALEAYVSTATAEVAESGDIGERECLLTLFARWPQVADVRNDVAEACREAGHLQQAELLLLQNCSSPNRTAAARARRLLTDLYSQHHLHREAATSLAELATDYRDDLIGHGLVAHEFVDQFPHDHPAWQVVRRRRSTPLPAYHVRITEHLCDENCAALKGCRSAGALKQHDRIRRKFFVGDDATLSIIDRGIVPGNRNHSQLTLVNRETGGSHADVSLPAAYWQLAGGTERRCGQFLPTCGRTAHGLSLLERRPIWSTEESDAGHTRDKVKLGPFGTDYCVLQTPRRLTVVHPGTGAVLWERGNLAPNVGLLTNEATGIIGDSETLTLFGAGQRSYTVYRMQSGCKVRHGRLDVSSADVRRFRQGIGSRLVHVVAEGEHEVLRIWDSETDRVLVEQALHEQLFCPIGSGTQYALINSEGRLLIVDASTGKVNLDLRIAEERLKNVTDLAVASDRDHFFVNLVGCPQDTTPATIAATDEVEVPHIRVQGDLMAVSKPGRVLWLQSVPDAVLLTNTECSLPVLTLVSRVRDSQSHQSSRLRIDVLDTRSGELLARRDDLLRTRIVQSAYHHRPGNLTLVGLNSQIEIAFGPKRRELLIHAELDESKDASLR